MQKGYWIAHVTIQNPERYKDYVAANAVAFKKYGARFLARGGQNESHGPGVASDQRHVVLEFESYSAARACYESPEYAVAMKIRDEASTVSLVILEGWDA